MNYQDLFDNQAPRKFIAVTEDTRAKLSAVHKGQVSHNKGKRLSDETRAKMSAARTGKPANNRGMTHSEEARAKISAANKGKTPANRKPIQTPNGLFDSVAATAVAYNTYERKVREWIKKLPDQFYYVNKGQ